MRKFIFSLGVALGVCFSVLSQPAYLGTKTPYVAAAAAGVAPPAGYQPVFVNYVGRHGARYLTKAGTDQQVLQVLVTADKNNGLTKMGVKVKAIAEGLLAAGKGNYEQITLLGRGEQAAIGERMRKQYSGVFKGRGLGVVTTWKLRTQQSAEAFLQGFGKYDGALKYERAPDSTDAVLRFYDLSPVYQRYKKSARIRQCLDSLDRDPRTVAAAKRICARLFKPVFLQTMGEGGIIAFADDLYDLYAIAYSMQGETGSRDSAGLRLAFDRDGLEWLDFRGGAADFMEKGPAFDSLGIQIKVAAPLLADFILSMDKFIDGRGVCDGVLRFTHAEAIAPFAALLGVRGASTPVRSIYRYHDHWHAEKVIPLSANIQWVLYAGGGGGRNYLVKVLLNEKEAVLPVGTAQWPYYRWEDLRAYYVQKLEGMKAVVGGNMNDYLREIE